jgi:hypothetical protein
MPDSKEYSVFALGTGVPLFKSYMLPGKVCGDVVQSGGGKWMIEERMKR